MTLYLAGYAYAFGDFYFFLAAMLLFTINTIFITLEIFLIVKFLRFPIVKYINSVKRRKITQMASTVAIIIFGFSVFQFIKLYGILFYKGNYCLCLNSKNVQGIYCNFINEFECF